MNYENPDLNILLQRKSTGSMTILNGIQSKAICALNKKNATPTLVSTHVLLTS